MSSNSRVIFITGANQGLGFEAIKQLSEKHPEDVLLLGSRDVEKGKQAISKARQEGHKLSNVHVVQIDVTKSDTITAAKEHIEKEYGRLDILINNAAIATVEGSRQISERVFDTNVYSVIRMNDTFLPLLSKASKPLIVVVSSGLGSYCNDATPDKKLADLILAPETWTADTPLELINDWLLTCDPATRKSAKYEWPDKRISWQAYGISKAILTGYSVWYAKQHPEVTVAIVTPGLCATNLNNYIDVPHVTPVSEGGKCLIWPVDNKVQSGHYYMNGKEVPFTMPRPSYFTMAPLNENES